MYGWTNERCCRYPMLSFAAGHLSIQRPASSRCCRSCLRKNREHRLDVDDLIAWGAPPRPATYLYVVELLPVVERDKLQAALTQQRVDRVALRERPRRESGAIGYHVSDDV